MQVKRYFKSIQIHTKNKYLRTYYLLAALRICLVFVPQLGYIHPDEFFQTIEVIAGEEYGLEYVRTWEFNSTLPIRSVAVPYFILKLPLNCFRFISLYVKHFLDIDLRTTYALLIIPRLVMCIISFINDWSLYKVCLSYGLKYDIRLLALGSSFVVLVFGSRTFSNTIEMALTSLLLYLVAECMVHSNTVIFQSEYLDDRYKEATTTVEKVKVYKLKSALPSHIYNKCIYISTLCVIGFFNRPTFVLFGMPIVFFWLLRGLGTKSVTFVHFNLRVFSFVACAIPTICLSIIVDSIYYGLLTMSDVEYMQISINNFVVTPLNFVRYNIDPQNTGKHGVHPRYLHLLVNIPLLYNILGITAVLSICSMVYRFFQADYKNLPRAQSVVSLMNSTIFVPVVMLSLINHQEPRFLIPITLPIILLHAPKLLTGLSPVYPFSTNHRLFQFIYKHFLSSRASAGYMLKYWYIINIFLLLFFGFVHQGGVIQMTQYLSNNQANPLQHNNQHIHLVTSHVYNVPMSLLMLPSTKMLLVNPENGQKYNRKKQFHLYEYGSMNMNHLQQKLKLLLDLNEMKRQTKHENYKLYLAIPSSLTEELSVAFFKSNHTLIKYHRVKIFYPHLSTEALPKFYLKHPTEIKTDVFDLDRTCHLFENQQETLPYSTASILKQFSSFIHQFGLVLYRVEVRRKQTFSE